MTIKELMEKTPNNIIIVDGQHKCNITQYSIFYDVFKDYVIDFIEADQNNNLLVTLKTQLIKKQLPTIQS